MLLREARQRAGMTQTELGRRARVAQSVISAYEAGAREPSLSTLRRLVAATGLELRLQVRRAPDGLSRLHGPLGRRVRVHRKELKRLADAAGAENVRVFGSVARGEDTEASDVDLLVNVAPGTGLLGLARLQRDLEELLAAPVDLIPAEGLKPGIRERVHQEAVSL